MDLLPLEPPLWQPVLDRPLEFPMLGQVCSEMELLLVPQKELQALERKQVWLVPSVLRSPPRR